MTAERQLAFALRDAYRWDDLVTLVAGGERSGFSALFLPEVGARDALATLAALAGETGSLRLGTGVVPLPARSPSLLAAAAATVQERSGGRLILGLGTGPSGPGSLERLRRITGALHEAFRGSSVQVDGAGIEVGLPLPAPPEIWLAALGPRATRLAGELADGVAAALEQVAAGARDAGRDPSEVTIAVYVRAPLADGSRAAALRAAADYASYPAYRRQFVEMGIDPSDGDAIVRAVMLHDRGSALARLDDYRAAGADLPVVYPVLPLGPPSKRAALEILRAVAPMR
jgi:alkanesulfonate monooxygenase SsuD/methylene tetrahydromethanopterin reductase-like flavin-dependent oxidoreductase (luciferase family)